MNNRMYLDPNIALEQYKKESEDLLNEMLDNDSSLEKITIRFKNKIFFSKMNIIIQYIKEKRPDKMYLISANELNLL